MTKAPDTHKPDVLTVEEAAKVLRIGRNNAYALARRWLATAGAEGLPVVRLGRCLRVPRAALDDLLDLDLPSPSNYSPVELVSAKRKLSRPASTL